MHQLNSLLPPSRFGGGVARCASLYVTRSETRCEILCATQLETEHASSWNRRAKAAKQRP